ncbi:hypothetical protein GGR32_001342 [Mesonia hippocampi]|uniref:DUF11 domain-containing protein n=1 Tax=Mesonia hippocampi TaxID=1628250 RepID=A0A840EPR1_9FLAO|nr:hypothetical protein [Mesonia hippocampi]MBB4119051.1 hypothetical protein [Mesonia hippocampi]
MFLNRKAIFLLLFTLSFFSLKAQIDFTPRQSSKAPEPYKNVSNYYLQGDFTMIGNTNLTLKVYSNNQNNSNEDMEFVDVDGDATTKNSSSAVLEIPDAECAEIIYAGLYWSGRGSSSLVYNGLDKRKVKLKKAGQAYQEINANRVDNNPEISFTSSNYSSIYAAYADVTDYVRTHGVGNYFVADIATIEGDGGATGYFGGWGMVVIYKNPAMKWRDITVFDGYGYMNSSAGSKTLPVSGFKSTQNGQVNIKMGMMAGEGDVGISGDYFHIERKNSGSYQALSHAGNSTNNFFNSSIVTGGNSRNPNLQNNTGMDISMFNLPNTNNSIIDNNQESTSFRFGSNQDTYSIFSIVFAVDAYVPKIEVENSNITPGVVNGGNVVPGQELSFNLDVRNKGTEQIRNAKIEIPLPSNVHFSEGIINETTYITGSSYYWENPITNSPSTDFTTIPGGKIIWEIGDIPLASDLTTILGSFIYKIKVTENCTILTTGAGGCGLEIPINGGVTGEGLTSGNLLEANLISDYGSGACAGPVYEDFETYINVNNVNCPNVTEDNIKQFVVSCKDVVERDIVTAAYPEGTVFYDAIPTETGASVVTGDFLVNKIGKTPTSYYAVLLGSSSGCYYKLETVHVQCHLITNPMLPSKAKK